MAKRRFSGAGGADDGFRLPGEGLGDTGPALPGDVPPAPGAAEGADAAPPEVVASKPPRTVPLATWLGSLFGGAALGGWVVLCIGTVVAVAMGVPGQVRSLIDFHGEMAEAEGLIVAVEDTKTRINEVEVYRYTFVFGGGASPHRGVCYTTGHRFRNGQAVTVRFRPDDPSVSCPVGARPGMLGPWSLVALVGPVVGLAWTALTVRRGLRGIRLLANGRVAMARLVERTATSMTVNDQRVWRLVFEFTDERERAHRVTVKTHVTGPLTDDPWERVFYDPERPDRAVLLDRLPASLDERGDPVADRPVGSYVQAAIAAVFVLGAAMFVAWWYGG